MAIFGLVGWPTLIDATILQSAQSERTFRTKTRSPPWLARTASELISPSSIAIALLGVAGESAIGARDCSLHAIAHVLPAWALRLRQHLASRRVRGITPTSNTTTGHFTPARHHRFRGGAELCGFITQMGCSGVHWIRIDRWVMRFYVTVYLMHHRKLLKDDFIRLEQKSWKMRKAWLNE